ncbi:uncharacterized protein LOC120174360 [Hibiscus syriacus]|uniref:uncharacterized protein LOC120174360 n=1 Tax=Hibiscus syriacus TaxID=106335 RepID=UPI0019240A2D|nr:uncharacterized protein LOC120174360 [Hibiscus syriacus]
MIHNVSDAFDNGNNLYYLHQYDNPGMVLVSQPLSSDNFHCWKRYMVLDLSAKKKLGFVDGSVVPSDPSSSELFNAWTQANNLVISWILNSVSKEIAANLLYHSSTSDMWKYIVERFQQSNGPQLFQLKKKLISLVQGQVRRVLDEQKQEQIFQFLMGLNNSFSHIRGKILLLDPFPSISKVISLIVQEENQRAIKLDTAGLMQLFLSR